MYFWLLGKFCVFSCIEIDFWTKVIYFLKVMIIYTKASLTHHFIICNFKFFLSWIEKYMTFLESWDKMFVEFIGRSELKSLYELL